MKSILILLFASLVSTQAKEITCPNGVSNITKKGSKILFEELKAIKDIPYKYVVDGCDVRAYLGAKHLNDTRGIISFRVNMESYPGMYLETPYTFENGVEFSKHSALALCVEGKPMVLDVSFFDKPVTIEQFYSALIDPDFIEDEDVRMYSSSMYNLNPEETRARVTFDRSSLRCANKIATRFMREQKKIERGQLPYGVGRSKEVLRIGICD